MIRSPRGLPPTGVRGTAPQLERYYDRRASEYENIYQKPERQHELEWLRHRIPEILRDRTVLEVACGTGYWTQFIARTALRLEACDINESVLEIAREKPIPAARVSFFKADAISLANGEEYEVLKNFPTAQELADAVRGVAAEAHLESLRYYWLMIAKLR